MLKIDEVENIRVPSGNESGAWQGFWELGAIYKVEFQKQLLTR